MRERKVNMANSESSRTAFLTVAEVADMVRVSRMTVYRWIHTGELPAVRFGRSFRVPQQAVEAFMEQAELAGGYILEDDERGSGTVG